MGGSDTALLRRWAAQRDAEAFAELVRRHSGMVYGTCLRVLRNAADAEDAAQESFLSLVRLAQGEGRLPASLGGWLHAVAVRRALDRLRSEGRRRAREDRSAEPPAAAPELDCDDVAARVDEAIAALPEELRYPLVRHFLEGASHREVARELGLARRTVTSRIARGVETVREELGRRGVVVSAVALASALAAESAHAAPPALAATLGKLAVAGATGAPAVTPAALVGTGVLLMSVKKVAVAVAGVALILAGWVARDGVDGVSRQIRSAVGIDTSDTDTVTVPASAPGPSRSTGRVATAPDASPAPALHSPAADGNRPEAPRVAPAAHRPDKNAAPEDAEPGSAVLEGTVLADGEPLAQQRVQLMSADEASLINGTTDAAGAYRFDDLRAGDVQVVAAYRDAKGGLRSAERSALLEPNLTTRVDFSFTATGSLEGVVRLDGAAPKSCTVRAEVAQSPGATESYTAQTDATGFYRFAATTGGAATVRVEATGEAGLTRAREASTLIEEGGISRLDFDIDSSKGGRIAGSVAGLAPGEQAGVYAVPGAADAPDSMSFVRFNALRSRSLGDAAVAPPGGEFRIEGLPEGAYTVTAVAMTGDRINDLLNWRVASGTVTVTDAGEARIDFDLGGEAPSPPVLSGTVAGFDPGDHAAVLVLNGAVDVPHPLTPAGLGSLTGRPAAVAELADDGTFDVGRLAPGTYTLVAIAGNPQDGAPRSVGTATVEIGEGSPATVELTLEDNAATGATAP